MNYFTVTNNTSNAATAGGSETVTAPAAFFTSAAAVAGAGSWDQDSNFFSIAVTSCRDVRSSRNRSS